MAQTMRDNLSKAQPITLDRPRKLMLTNHAWSKLEEAYGSMAGALRAFAEMNTGHRALTHVMNWLWALLQEEVRLDNEARRQSEQEELTLKDVESMVVPADIIYYTNKIAETVTAYYPIPGPPEPAPKMAIPGIGGGSMSFSGGSTVGVKASFWARIFGKWMS